MSQRVEFIEQREHRHVKIEPDKYTFHSVGRLSILQRLAFWFLRRSKSLTNANVAEISYTRHSFSKLDVVDQLLAQHNSLFNELGRPPKRVLIGSKNFAELMNSKEIRDNIVFNVPIHFSNERGRRIFDMEIEIIPWMEGILVMP